MYTPAVTVVISELTSHVRDLPIMCLDTPCTAALCTRPGRAAEKEEGGPLIQTGGTSRKHTIDERRDGQRTLIQHASSLKKKEKQQGKRAVWLVDNVHVCISWQATRQADAHLGLKVARALGENSQICDLILLAHMPSNTRAKDRVCMAT